MTDKAWKAMERKIAKALGGKRTPLSGMNSLHTSGDVIHDTLYVEVKMRKNVSELMGAMLRNTLAEVEKEAIKEGKDWMLVFKKTGSKKTYVLMNFKTLETVMK